MSSAAGVRREAGHSPAALRGATGMAQKMYPRVLTAARLVGRMARVADLRGHSGYPGAVGSEQGRGPSCGGGEEAHRGEK